MTGGNKRFTGRFLVGIDGVGTDLRLICAEPYFQDIVAPDPSAPRAELAAQLLHPLGNFPGVGRSDTPRTPAVSSSLDRTPHLLGERLVGVSNGDTVLGVIAPQGIVCCQDTAATNERGLRLEPNPAQAQQTHPGGLSPSPRWEKSPGRGLARSFPTVQSTSRYRNESHPR